MTYEEARKALEIAQQSLAQSYKAGSHLAMEINGLAIEALEKQIPKKPHLRKLHSHEAFGFGKNVEYFECPNECGATVLTCHRYCRNCGQAIDWSDTE